MNILNLPAWSVLDTREADHDYHITVQLTYPPSYCPHCGAVANLQGYGGKEQLFLDLPIQMKRVAIDQAIEAWYFSCLINTLIRIALMQITCRMCDTQAEAQPDAVLLCGPCRADPDATARHICDVLALCEQTHTRLLADLSADDTRRFLNVKRARRAAAAKGTLDTFNGRHAEAMARGDALSDMLSADATLNDTRAWAERAQAELEALAVTL